MAIITERSLFGWKDVEELGDLQRLHLVLKYLPDGELMEGLEEHRNRGRDDYPVRPMWNSLIAGVLFEHRSIASLRRELRRNGQLRQVCGFDCSTYPDYAKLNIAGAMPRSGLSRDYAELGTQQFADKIDVFACKG